MKKIFWLTFLMLTIISCSRDENSNNESNCKIVSAKPYNYIFDDVDYRIDQNFTNFSFEYNSQNSISKVIGGFLPIPFAGYFLSNEAYDEITYSGNTVYVNISANQASRPYNKEFVIKNGKILSQKITYFSYPEANYPPVNFTYEYLGSIVNERYSGVANNRIRKTFTIENGNLSKIEVWKYDSSGNIAGKDERAFSGYDDQENLLKGKFFVNGAFYMAFSNNVFSRVDYATYELQNEVYVKVSSGYYETTDTPNYFVENCD